MSWKSYDWRKSGCQIQSDTIHPEEKRNNWGSRISPLIEKLEPYIKPYITKIDDAVGQLQRQISQAVQKAGGVVDDTFRLEPVAGETIETLGKEIQSSLDVKEELQTVVADEVKTGIESGSSTISQAERIKIDAWDYTPSDELYLRYKDVFDNPKYYNQKTGVINWSQNDGFASTPIDEVLQPGTRIDRYGSDFGSVTSPEGIPYEMRAVAPGTDLKPYSVFEVVEPINVKAGKIAPWFDESGGGIQYLLPDTVDELLDAGILRRIK